MSETWVTVGAVGAIDRSDVVRVDHGGRTFAVYRTADDRYFATDGLCTHGRVHLADGFVDGTTIECPKHNGRFDLTTGKAKGTPALVDLGCHPLRVTDGRIELRVA
ncbi:MAG: Rieske 2Fe-2S domain-containing protein [Acidimicrobiales bacterium]